MAAFDLQLVMNSESEWLKQMHAKKKRVGTRHLLFQAWESNYSVQFQGNLKYSK